MKKPNALSMLQDTYGPEHAFKAKVKQQVDELQGSFTIAMWDEETASNQASLLIIPLRDNEITMDDIFLGGRKKRCKKLLDEIHCHYMGLQNIGVVLRGNSIQETLLILLNAGWKYEKRITEPSIATTFNVNNTEIDVMVTTWETFIKAIKHPHQ